MATLNDRVFDNGLSVLDTEANALHICSSLPSTFSAATTSASLGSKSGPSVSAPADRSGGGREVTVAAITDGNVTGIGTASHYALVDTVNSRLLAAGALQSSQAVTAGNTFSLGSFTIGIPDPA